MISNREKMVILLLVKLNENATVYYGSLIVMFQALSPS